MSDDKRISLDDDARDRWALYFRTLPSIVGGLTGPLGAIFGPVVGEALAAGISGQRLDRIARVLGIIRGNLSDDDLAKIPEVPDRLALLEETLILAGITTQKDRVENIGRAASEGLKQEMIDLDSETRVLSILRNLDTSDIVCLHYFAKPVFGAQRLAAYLEQQHPHMFYSKQLTFGAPEEEKAKRRAAKSNFALHAEQIRSLGLVSLQELKVQVPSSRNMLSDQVDFGPVISQIVEKAAAHLSSHNFVVSSLGLEVLKRLPPIDIPETFQSWAIPKQRS